jgi:hypothetical protein
LLFSRGKQWLRERVAKLRHTYFVYIAYITSDIPSPEGRAETWKFPRPKISIFPYVFFFLLLPPSFLPIPLLLLSSYSPSSSSSFSSSSSSSL